MNSTAPQPLSQEELILQQAARIKDLEKRLNTLENSYNNVLSVLAQRNRTLFGKRSEQHNDARQLSLFPEMYASAQQFNNKSSLDDATHTSKKKKKRSYARKSVATLPRIIEDVYPEGYGPSWCASECYDGYDKHELLDYQPMRMQIKEVRTHKFRTPSGVPVVPMVPASLQPLPKGRPTPMLLSQIFIAKYCDHIPLYRQEQQYARMGFHLNRSTMWEWIEWTALEYLTPIVTLLHQLIMRAYFIQADTSPFRQLDRSCKQSHLFCYKSPFDNAVVFHFSRSLRGDVAKEHCVEFRGVLQCDAHSSFNELFTTPERIRAGCFAHARRKFDEAKLTDRTLADSVLSQIGKIYAVEKTTKGLPLLEKLKIRQLTLFPKCIELKKMLLSYRQQVLPQSPMNKAITYTLENWQPLTRFVHDPYIEIDNNGLEREFKATAVGKKNYLFFGSDSGGKVAAAAYSLIQTCKLQNINPFVYLSDVIAKMAEKYDPHELLPSKWKDSFHSTDDTS